MTTEPTVPTQTGTLADLRSAVETLTYLQATHANLPAPYVTLVNSGGAVDVQTNSPDFFEQWRVALQIPPADVELHVYAGGVWLQCQVAVRGVTVELSGHGLPITPEQACAVQDPAGVLPVAPIAVYPIAATAGGAE
ncbi:hypothetical protein [Streptomyces sp. NPDC048438]|uniref:hypothetical protein n=1 Tax=Streptomyces sp. NPDC048438 TaxID=3365551 RepID=UPI00371CCCD2